MFWADDVFGVTASGSDVLFVTPRSRIEDVLVRKGTGDSSDAEFLLEISAQGGVGLTAFGGDFFGLAEVIFDACRRRGRSRGEPPRGSRVRWTGARLLTMDSYIHWPEDRVVRRADVELASSIALAVCSDTVSALSATDCAVYVGQATGRVSVVLSR